MVEIQLKYIEIDIIDIDGYFEKKFLLKIKEIGHLIKARVNFNHNQPKKSQAE